jgi:drug/metabolite transporter (DMT)-like permease
MPTWVLFLVPTLIWASTWHVITYQLGSVPVLNSVTWRFALAALCLALWAWQRGQSLRLDRRSHALMLATGVVQYFGNYWGVYEAERFLPSGLVAVLFSMLVFSNALLAWWLWQQPVSRRFLAAAGGAVAGVVLVFWPELAAGGARPDAGYGLLVALGALAASCAGGFMTMSLTRRGLPLLPVLAWSMGYGALFMLLLSLLTGQGLHFDTGWPYVLSWLYLSLFGSVIAFAFYFKLAERAGMAKAALMAVVIPVIALLASALFEGWQATPLALAGMGLCLLSVWVAQRQKH